MSEQAAKQASTRVEPSAEGEKSDYIVSPTDSLLITGSNGFIGAKVVELLLKQGFSRLRCLVRCTSNLARLKAIFARAGTPESSELIVGDLTSRDDCRRACEGVSVIFHLAAGIEKSFAGAFMNSVLGTRNLLEAFLECGQPRRIVNVSSFAVYSNLRLRRGAILDENCPVEDSAQARYDPYGFGKLKQEELLVAFGKKHRLPYVILRPGTVFGPGRRSLSGRIGIDTFGFFLHMGGSNMLPLTFVDNCAEAIVLAGLKPGLDCEIFNIVDDDLPTSQQFLRAYKRYAGSFFSLSVPYPVAYALSTLWEHYSHWSKGQLPPVFNRRRCSAEWKGNRYSNQKLRQRLGWKPRVGLQEAMDRFGNQFRTS